MFLFLHVLQAGTFEILRKRSIHVFTAQREVQNKQLDWSKAACPFLTDAAIDFLSRLLDRNEKTRLTASQGEYFLSFFHCLYSAI